MYFFYHPTSRKIISATAMGLSAEDLETLRPPGAEVIEQDPQNIPFWRGELADYYVSDEGTLIRVNTYMDFNSIISIKVGETFTWEVIDENSHVLDIARGTEHYPSIGDIITFTATDPGVYRFEISSKTYKTAILAIEVTL